MQRKHHADGKLWKILTLQKIQRKPVSQIGHRKVAGDQEDCLLGNDKGKVARLPDGKSHRCAGNHEKAIEGQNDQAPVNVGIRIMRHPVEETMPAGSLDGRSTCCCHSPDFSIVPLSAAIVLTLTAVMHKIHCEADNDDN